MIAQEVCLIDTSILYAHTALYVGGMIAAAIVASTALVVWMRRRA